MLLILSNWWWETLAVPGDPHWTAPAGGRVALDLRTHAQCASPGIETGPGLFVYDLDPGFGIRLGDDPTALLTSTQKRAISDTYGWTINESRIHDWLWYRSALMPTMKRILELRLGGGIGLVRSEAFEILNHERGAEVQTRIQAQYRAQREFDLARGSEFYKKRLDWWEHKYRVPYQHFIPPDLEDEGKLARSTSIGDSFNRADDTDLNALDTGKTLNGGAGTWQWAEVLNNTEIQDETWRQVGTTAGYARAEQDLAGDDHSVAGETAVIVLSATSSRQWGACARFDAAANSSYMAQRNWVNAIDDSNSYVRLRKTTAGTRSDLGDPIVSTVVVGEVVKTEVDGSTLKSYLDGVEQDSITDETFSGQVRTGLYIFSGGGSDRVAVDDFAAEDLAPGGTILPHMMQYAS